MGRVFPQGWRDRLAFPSSPQIDAMFSTCPSGSIEHANLSCAPKSRLPYASNPIQSPRLDPLDLLLDRFAAVFAHPDQIFTVRITTRRQRSPTNSRPSIPTPPLIRKSRVLRCPWRLPRNRRQRARALRIPEAHGAEPRTATPEFPQTRVTRHGKSPHGSGRKL